MQNLGSFRPLGAILGAPSHTKLDFAIPLYGWDLIYLLWEVIKLSKDAYNGFKCILLSCIKH